MKGNALMGIKERSVTYSAYLYEQNAMDDIYSIYQKQAGISDAEFWCMFSVYKGECQYQHEICRHMFMNKQTVNSALKQLERKGLIEMVIPKRNQRVRKIVFTVQGENFCKNHLDGIDSLEQKAWNSLSDEEQDVMLHAMRKINSVLADALQIEYVSSED